MKKIACRDFGMDCTFQATAATEEELLQQAAAHAQEVHQMEVTPEVLEHAKTLIKEE